MSFVKRVIQGYNQDPEKSEQEKLDNRINNEVFACKVSQGFYQDPYFEGF